MGNVPLGQAGTGFFHSGAATTALEGAAGDGGALFLAKVQRETGVQGDLFTLGFGRWVAKAIVAYGFERGGQDVAEVPGDELGTGERFGLFDIAVGAVFPEEGDVGVRHL